MVKITVYTKNGCPQCDMTKRVLDENEVKYEAINVEEVDPETGNKTDKAEKAFIHVKDVLGFSAMPVVEVEGQGAFAGFRPDKLNELVD